MASRCACVVSTIKVCVKIFIKSETDAMNPSSMYVHISGRSALFIKLHAKILISSWDDSSII